MDNFLATFQVVRDADKPFSAAGASLMFPRDPAGPTAETVNCGCQSLPWMESWEVKHPGRKAFSEEESATQPDSRRAVKFRGVLTISTTTGWGGRNNVPLEADRGG